MGSHQLPELVGSRSETHFVCVSKGDTMYGGVCGPRGEPASSWCRGGNDVVFASNYIGGLKHPGASSWETGIQGPSMRQTECLSPATGVVHPVWEGTLSLETSWYCPGMSRLRLSLLPVFV